MTIPQATRDAAVDAYREGLDTLEVAGLTGISRPILDQWQQEASSHYDESFATAAAKAKATHVRDTIRSISTSRASDPNLALKWLQASPQTRDRYGQRTDTVVDAAAAALALLASRLPPPPPAASLSASVTPLIEERAREGDVLEADGGGVLDGDEVEEQQE